MSIKVKRLISFFVLIHFISSTEPKAQGELIVWDSSRRPSVRGSTLSYMNISEINWLIVIIFNQKHQWGWGLTALGFGPDGIRTLVYMATDSSHRVIIGKPCDHSSSFFFDWFFFILAGNKDTHKISDGFEIGQYLTKDL